MHFIVAWRFNVPDSGGLIGQELSAVLKPYSWVRPLTDFYIVESTQDGQYRKIIDDLTAVARRHADAFYFMVSPPMNGGRYEGWLKADLWPEINKRST